MTKCSFCEGEGLIEHGATSKFFAKVTRGSDPWPVPVFHCSQCGSRQFGGDLSEEELGRLYRGYRSDRYFRERNAFEPWYTREINDSLGGEAEFKGRRKVLLDALARCGVQNDFDNVLDHGGDRGQMVVPEGGLNARRRFVFEVSGVDPENGVHSIAEDRLATVEWDLILSCHVLEHVLSPVRYLDKLVELGREGTWFFIEVPYEDYRASSFVRSKLQQKWLAWLCKTDLFFKFVDFASTGCRVKLRFLPAFCFHALREHLQFFTANGLRRLLARAGLEVRFCEVGACGHITALARKPIGPGH